MKRTRNIRILSAVCLLLLLLLAGCGKTEETPVTEETMPAAVFHGADVKVRGEPVANVLPYYDAEAGTLAVVVCGAEDEPIRYAREVFRLTEDGAEPVEGSAVPLALPEGSMFVSGALAEDGHVFLLMEEGGSGRTYRILRKDGAEEPLVGRLCRGLLAGVLDRHVLAGVCLAAHRDWLAALEDHVVREYLRHANVRHCGRRRKGRRGRCGETRGTRACACRHADLHRFIPFFG